MGAPTARFRRRALRSSSPLLLLAVLLGLCAGVLRAPAWACPRFRASRVAPPAARGAVAAGGPLGAALPGRPLAAAALPPHAAEGLLRELLPDLLVVNYTATRSPGCGYQSAAEVTLRGIPSQAFIGDREQEEAAAVRSALEAARRSLLAGVAGEAGPLAPDAAGAEVDLVGHEGEIAFTRAPLPIGLLVDCSTYRVGGGEGGAPGGFQAVARVRLPGVKSQAHRGAFSEDERGAQESAAFVVQEALGKLLAPAAKDQPLVVRPRQPQASARPPPEDRRAALARSLRELALGSLNASDLGVRAVALPLGGFLALGELRSPSAVRAPGVEALSWPGAGPGPAKLTCRLRGDVSATRRDAEESALEAVYEALLQPAWKTTAVLSAPRTRQVLQVRSVDDDDLALYSRWREERLEAPERGGAAAAAAGAPGASLELWYGGVCLCCLTAVSYASWRSHAAGGRHRRSFAACPVRLKRGLKRLPAAPGADLYHYDSFAEAAGWESDLPILSVGEMDFSFSLALARLRPRGSALVATSYLQAFSAGELERYPEDDADRAGFSRRTLPSMAGALQRNLRELEQRGAEVLHGVDATNLQGTLRPRRFRREFGCAVFPFPRASLRRENDPRNSELVRGYLRSAAPGAGLVAAGGAVQLLLLGPQYEEWDVAGAAADAGLVLGRRSLVPRHFYQTREVSGKAWDFGEGAELLSFTAPVPQERPARRPSAAVEHAGAADGRDGREERGEDRDGGRGRTRFRSLRSMSRRVAWRARDTAGSVPRRVPG